MMEATAVDPVVMQLLALMDAQAGPKKGSPKSWKSPSREAHPSLLVVIGERHFIQRFPHKIDDPKISHLRK